RNNNKRIEQWYKPRNTVMLRVPKAFQSKTKAIAHVPYTIKSIHSNGMVTIDKCTTTQQVSIRRIFPC
ncbi:hypothetical protein F442_18372, partial [Phytophthora nicotianae P10297]